MAGEDVMAGIAFDAAWDDAGGNEICGQCGGMMDSGNRCPKCEPERYPEVTCFDCAGVGCSYCSFTGWIPAQA